MVDEPDELDARGWKENFLV